MKKILPIIVVLLFLFAQLIYPLTVNATSHLAPTATPTPEPAAPEGSWFPDSEVTFVGKAASRSDSFLNWTIQNYDWLCVTKDANKNCDNSSNPVIDFWKLIRNIMYAFLALFVLATAFIMIVTRGKNITILKFLPRFAMIFLLITLSYAFIVFFYQIVDAITGFFFRVSDQATNVRRLINSSDLLFVGFDYSSFIGFRKAGVENDESAFISLLLVRLTAVTYYVMTGLLLIRKIILWFFVVVSPIFPILLFYSPLRNTAKIWIGEFFRWLLYAPLFAVFLHGVVEMWRSPAAIPLQFPELIANPDPRTIDPASTTQYYPTAINILLGGPGQTIDITNSVNINDTFALYVVALLMLWVVILLPFLLLKIFLDYINSVSLGNNLMVQKIKNTNLPFIGKGFPPGPTPPGSQPPGLTQPTGMAMALPFLNKKSVVSTRVGSEKSVSVQKQKEEINQVLKITNLSIPKMRDIARFETSMISKNQESRTEINKVSETLEKIANPTTVSTPLERERVSVMREKLIEERQKGNPIATQILSASSLTSQMGNSRHQTIVQPHIEVTVQLSQLLKNIANPSTVILPKDHERVQEVRSYLTQEKEKGNPLATEVLHASEQINRKVEQRQVINELSEELVREKSTTNNRVATAILDSGMPLDSILRTLANPDAVQGIDQQKITEIQNILNEETQHGNTLSEKVIQTSKIVAQKTLTSEEEKKTIENLETKLVEENKKGNEVAQKVLPQQTPAAVVSIQAKLPNENTVQQVSIEEYEEVRKMWEENYQNLEIPVGLDGQQAERTEWLASDIEKMNNTINLLNSQDEKQVKQGMEAVANILPFLLIGGFSRSEVITYLKAKLEAAKAVTSILKKKEDEEDTLLGTKEKEEQATMVKHAMRELPEDEPKEDMPKTE
ncbi:MAG: hypothetical protein KA477_00235 [Candidatus Levybacteria bacterium]|nr:hypothetical protein [Candidatus Levybacteria bacterium]